MGNSHGREARETSPSGRNRNRQSRGDMNMFGMPGNGAATASAAEAPFERKETRAEREQRRLNRERMVREMERERSIAEEHVDGGYLVTLGTYIGTEDYSKTVVRQLQIERKLAPFWRGMNDFEASWSDVQVIAVARGQPKPEADAPLPPDLAQGPAMSPAPSPSEPSLRPPRSAKKAIAAAFSLASRAPEGPPPEYQLPHDPFVNGSPLELALYRDGSECPICFLYYPPHLNHTRCCDQPICSECFVQIRRPKPHYPEHHPDGTPHAPATNGSPEPVPENPELLISEPAQCPYCQQPDFGVTYCPPPFRRGLAYADIPSFPAAMSSHSSLNSNPPGSPASSTFIARRRTQSLSATAPNVITTDRVRPDWAQKLAAKRAQQARRAAAATALHNAAFVAPESTESRALAFAQRLRRGASDNDAGGPPNQMDELENTLFMEAEAKKAEKEAEKEAKKAEKELKRANRRSVFYGGDSSGSGTPSLGLGRLSLRGSHSDPPPETVGQPGPSTLRNMSNASAQQ